jgi:hypothetical protein
MPVSPRRARENRFPQPFHQPVRAISISVRQSSHPGARFPVRAAISRPVRAISRFVRAIFPSVRRFSYLCGHFPIRAGKICRV